MALPPKRREALLTSLLIGLGLAQMLGDLTGLAPLKGLAAATMASPAPKVFSAVKGLETYSTRFFLEWRNRAGERRRLELDKQLYARLGGPYNRRNVYGALLAYGPVLQSTEATRPMFEAGLGYALGGEAPLLRELGLDPAEMVGPAQIRFEPRPGTNMGSLPTLVRGPTR